MLIIFTKNHCKIYIFVDTAVISDPVDISPYGKLKDIEPQKLNLPAKHQFPTTDGRKFNQKWLNDYVWLEYSLIKDAVYCYACRQYSPSNEKDNAFKLIGFSHWKSALDSKKGIKKHQSSTMHTNSMAKWSEAIIRQKSNSSVIELASGNVLQCRRNYVKKIIEVLYFHS